MFKIVRREEISGGTVILNEIEAPLIAKKTRPGQFVILKAHEEGDPHAAVEYFRDGFGPQPAVAEVEGHQEVIHLRFHGERHLLVLVQV